MVSHQDWQVLINLHSMFLRNLSLWQIYQLRIFLLLLDHQIWWMPLRVPWKKSKSSDYWKYRALDSLLSSSCRGLWEHFGFPVVAFGHQHCQSLTFFILRAIWLEDFVWLHIFCFIFWLYVHNNCHSMCNVHACSDF